MSELLENAEESAESASGDHFSLDVKSDNIENTNTEKFIIFSIKDNLYSFNTRYIGEIALFDAVYPLPLMPPFVLGVINRYSIPYALFDLNILFNNAQTPRNKVLIVKDEIDRIAFLIDDVSGIADIPLDTLHVIERELEANDLAEAVSAAFKWNESNVFVLDIHRILARVSGGVS